MNRLEDWFERLNAVVDKHRDLPFEYGKSDCCILAMDAIEALIGVDPYPEERAYDTRIGGEKLMLKRGFISPVDAVAAIAKMEVPPSFAQRGDICEIRVGNVVGLGVCVGLDVVCKNEEGLTFVPRQHISKAYRFA